MKRILAVDDEEPILKCFERALRARGYYIRTTSDPDEALEILKNEDFDLVMLDVRMPKTSGFEIYGQIKRKGRAMAVLFVTAFPASFTAKSDSIAQMWTEQFSDGNTDILYKPFELQTLNEKVEALIGPADALEGGE